MKCDRCKNKNWKKFCDDCKDVKCFLKIENNVVKVNELIEHLSRH